MTESSEDRLYYTYDYIHHHTLKLINAISEKHSSIDYIVGISRGGLVPAVTMSHHMGLPLIPVQWSTRDHSQRVHNLAIAEDLQGGATILLVDDINDSGKTFVELIEDWEYNSESEGRLITASIFQRYTTQMPSDFHSKMINSDAWVVMPWEKH